MVGTGSFRTCISLSSAPIHRIRSTTSATSPPRLLSAVPLFFSPRLRARVTGPPLFRGWTSIAEAIHSLVLESRSISTSAIRSTRFRSSLYSAPQHTALSRTRTTTRGFSTSTTMATSTSTAPPGDEPSAATTSSTPSSSSLPGPQTTSTETVISQPHRLVTCFSCPFNRFGVLPIGGRSTAVQLTEPPNEGALWVLASSALDEPTKKKVTELGGKVKYIIAADNVHSMYVEQWATAYPDAKCIGVEGLDAKRPQVKWAGLYGVDDEASTKYGFESEIQARYFPTFSNKDVIFHHVASRSLITADLLFNLPCKEQYLGTKAGKPTSWVPFAGMFSKGMRPQTGFHQNFLWQSGAMCSIPKACDPSIGSNGGSTAERRARFGKDAEAVAAWDFERIIPCHGDVIEKTGKQAWLAACKKYLDDKGKSTIGKA